MCTVYLGFLIVFFAKKTLNSDIGLSTENETLIATLNSFKLLRKGRIGIFSYIHRVF